MGDFLKRQGYSLQVIHHRLSNEGNIVSLRSLQRVWSKFQNVHTVRDLPRVTRPRLLTAEMVSALEDCLRNEDEMTARKLKTMLAEKFTHFPNVLLATIKRNCQECGWVCTRPHYCQLIRDDNKIKRKEWCQQQLDNDEQFEDVIFTDECTIQLDHHGRLCFRKEKAPQILKQRAKHLAKIHIWKGISMRGATHLIMFKGNMNAIRYDKIVEAGLVSFVKRVFQMVTGVNRTMTLNIVVSTLGGFSNSMTFTGGKLLQSPQILILWKTVGVP